MIPVCVSSSHLFLHPILYGMNSPFEQKQSVHTTQMKK